MGNRRVVERFTEALAANDYDTLDALTHDDYLARWPQSGEVVRGRANMRAIQENYPGANSGLSPSMTCTGRPSWRAASSSPMRM